MSKIKIEEIRSFLEDKKWKLLSPEYKNLETLMTFECPEGHQVQMSWKTARSNLKCPICDKNPLKKTDNKVIPKPKGKRILALDQASHDCGWAIFDENDLVKFGVFHLSEDSEIIRINKLKMWLISMIVNWNPTHIALEGIQLQDTSDGRALMGVTVFQTLARLQGVLIDTCYDYDIIPEVCPTATWRNFCGVKGKKRADRKRSMQLLAKEWYDISVTNDEADAIGIGRYYSNLVTKKLSIVDWE